MKHLSLLVVSCLLMILTGCSREGKHADLHQFMEDARMKPSGEIEALPVFPPYKTTSYAAVALRSPFDTPVLLVDEKFGGGKKAVKPDEGRKKEYLEGFNFAALSMVGTLQQHGTMWALLDDGDGGVHRVKENNFVGRNHGKIVTVTESRVDVIEIVPDGKGGWVERPRALTLREKE